MVGRGAPETRNPREAPPGHGGSSLQPAAQLAYRIKSLPMAATVLEVGAHPDDEDTGLHVYLSHGLGARVVFWSATRGEGGQNRRGADLEEALGVVRTWESLQARALDGGEALYGPFYDYGFAKHGEDALQRWGREDVLREVVRAIRLVQPLVLVSRWSGGAGDGHGHHQAIGLVAAEAVDAAADPSRFPELAEQGLLPWRAQKLYRSVAADWQPGEDSHFGELTEEYEQAGYVRIATGDFDPIAGTTHQEQAHLAVNRHRSQGMGFIPAPGPFFSYYHLERSVTSQDGRETGFFDGLDPSLTGLADEPGGGLPVLRERLEAVRVRAESAIAAFRPPAPAPAGLLVAEGATLLHRLNDDLTGFGLPPDAAAALQAYLYRKARDFEDVAAACLGIRAECVLDRARTTPGRPVGVRGRVWNGGPEHVEVARLELDVPEGWLVSRSTEGEIAPPAAGPFEAAYEIYAPEDAPLSTPYWLRDPRTPYRYAWPEGGPLGRPLDPPLVSAVAEVAVGGHVLTLIAPGLHASSFVGGFRHLPLAILPPLTVSPRQVRELVPAGESEALLDLAAHVRCLDPEGTEGTIAIRAPAGWTVEPPAASLRFESSGESRTVHFGVTVPASASPGTYELAFEVESEGRDSAFDLEPVRLPAEGALGPVDDVNCGWEAFHIRRATLSAELVDVEFPSALRCAYVEGMSETILSSLARFDLDITPLDDEELAFADLSHFEAIVVGPNAYNLRDALRENAHRLLAYAAEGGTLIVQYQAYGYDEDGLAPYPFTYHQPHDRVTRPEAPVDVLEPDHSVVTAPNRLTAADFEGWVHDRGLYFFGEWDSRYRPILASADPGEDQRSGGLLVAHYGRGTFVYVGYSLFRQIPAGVPGAIRLFANLIGLAEARIRTRVEVLRSVPLLDELSEPELAEAAHAMAEHTVPAGEYLSRQGHRGTEMFILTDGSVEVVEESAGQERVLSVVQPVESLGDLAVLGHIAHSASLRALDDATVLVLPESELRDWLRRHPDLALRLLARIIAHRDAHR